MFPVPGRSARQHVRGVGMGGVTRGREGEQRAIFNTATIALSAPNETTQVEHLGERENVPHENTSSGTS